MTEFNVEELMQISSSIQEVTDCKTQYISDGDVADYFRRLWNLQYQKIAVLWEPSTNRIESPTRVAITPKVRIP